MLFAVRNIAESVPAHDSSCVQCDSVSQLYLVIKDHPGVENALLPKDAVLPHNGTRMENTSVADKGAGGHGDMRADINVPSDHRLRRND